MLQSQLLLEHINYNANLIYESNSKTTLDQINQLITLIINTSSYSSLVKQHLPKTTAKYGTFLSNAGKQDNVILKNILGTDRKIKLNDSLTSSFNSIIDQSSIVTTTIFTVSDSTPNAFTIPGVYSEMDVSKLTVGHILLGIHPKIELTSVNNGVISLSNSFGKNISPFIFTTTGFNRLKLNTNEKYAIILHEIGHWQSKTLNLRLFSFILTMIHGLVRFNTGISSLMFLILLPVLILSSHFVRITEFDADLFAKNAGFGKPLANALRSLSGQDRVKSKQHLKELTTILEKLSGFMDIVRSHPSNYRRGKMLLGESILPTTLVIMKLVEPLLTKLDNIISSESFIPEIAIFSGK